MKKISPLKLNRTTLAPLDLERILGGSLGGGKSTNTSTQVNLGSHYSCEGGFCPVEK